MIHRDGARLVIDLGIDPGIPNQIDDPLLAILETEPEPLAEVGDVDPLMDLAVGLADEVTGGFDEGVGDVVFGEEVGTEHGLCVGEVALGFFEVEIDVERADEGCDCVGVFVAFLADDPGQVFDLFLVCGAG